MGKKKKPADPIRNRSKTLPSSPTHSSSSSSSSDFEFRITASPRKSTALLCPADELFYKGQILPLHLSPRISMVPNLLLASSSSSSSSDTTTTASRDSSSSNDSTSSSFVTDLSLLAVCDPCCDSFRPSSVTDDDNSSIHNHNKKSCKYFSLSRISNVFKKDPPSKTNGSTSLMKPTSSTSSYSSAKEVIRKYLKKVKPLYDKLSSSSSNSKSRDSMMVPEEETTSFSGNLMCPKMLIRRTCVASCPSSMRSSPSHSGVLTRTGMPVRPSLGSYGSSGSYSSETSTMEELQSAIQGAIAHCKNSMIQTTTSSFNLNPIPNHIATGKPLVDA